MFEPLKQTIELLKTYDQEMPEDTHKQLEVWVVQQKTICKTNLSWVVY